MCQFAITPPNTPRLRGGRTLHFSNLMPVPVHLPVPPYHPPRAYPICTLWRAPLHLPQCTPRHAACGHPSHALLCTPPCTHVRPPLYTHILIPLRPPRHTPSFSPSGRGVGRGAPGGHFGCGEPWQSMIYTQNPPKRTPPHTPTHHPRGCVWGGVWGCV